MDKVWSCVWEKPTVKLVKCVSGKRKTRAKWKMVRAINATLIEDSGSRTTLYSGQGVLIGYRYDDRQAELKFEVFVKNGEERPIEDVGGIIEDEYDVGLIPSDEENKDFIFERCSVSVEEIGSSSEGVMLKYVFKVE